MSTKTYRPEPAYDLVRWTYGEVGLSTEELMRPSTYSRARGLSRWPDRMSAGRPKPPVCTDGIGTTMAKSFASKAGQEAYALRVELGERAYAELTGKRKRTRAVAKPKSKGLDPSTQAAVRTRADGGGVVSLSDHELVKALGIKPIGYLD